MLARSLAALIALVSPALADPDKSAFSLFDPTPQALLRPFNPDRPGQSHDPTTIDAGHVQLEMGLLEGVFDRQAGSSTRRIIYPNPIIRLGLTNDVELQVGTPLATTLRTGGPDPIRAQGIGDTTVGFKANLIGNDGGDHLLAILPTIKLPTAAQGLGNDHAEFLVSATYNYKITPDLLFTVEPSAGLLRSTDNLRYRDGYGLILGLDQTIAKVWVASIEVSAQASTGRGERTMFAVSPSLGYEFIKDVQIDVGINFGLNRFTPAYNPYLGLSVRY